MAKRGRPKIDRYELLKFATQVKSYRALQELADAALSKSYFIEASERVAFFKECLKSMLTIEREKTIAYCQAALPKIIRSNKTFTPDIVRGLEKLVGLPKPAPAHEDPAKNAPSKQAGAKKRGRPKIDRYARLSAAMASGDYMALRELADDVMFKYFTAEPAQRIDIFKKCLQAMSGLNRDRTRIYCQAVLSRIRRCNRTFTPDVVKDIAGLINLPQPAEPEAGDKSPSHPFAPKAASESTLWTGRTIDSIARTRDATKLEPICWEIARSKQEDSVKIILMTEGLLAIASVNIGLARRVLQEIGASEPRLLSKQSVQDLTKKLDRFIVLKPSEERLRELEANMPADPPVAPAIKPVKLGPVKVAVAFAVPKKTAVEPAAPAPPVAPASDPQISEPLKAVRIAASLPAKPPARKPFSAIEIPKLIGVFDRLDDGQRRDIVNFLRLENKQKYLKDLGACFERWMNRDAAGLKECLAYSAFLAVEWATDGESKTTAAEMAACSLLLRALKKYQDSELSDAIVVCDHYCHIMKFNHNAGAELMGQAVDGLIGRMEILLSAGQAATADDYLLRASRYLNGHPGLQTKLAARQKKIGYIRPLTPLELREARIKAAQEAAANNGAPNGTHHPPPKKKGGKPASAAPPQRARGR